MQRIAFYTIYPFLLLISLLPFRILYLFSDVLCFLMYRVVKYRKKTVRKNIRTAGVAKNLKHAKAIEKDFYKQFDYEVEYLGHPLLDAVFNYKNELEVEANQWKQEGRPLIALLPGSREQELNKMLLKMIEVEKQFPNCDFVIAGVDALPPPPPPPQESRKNKVKSRVLFCCIID